MLRKHTGWLVAANSRGVALYDGKVFRAALDNRIIAYDAKDGKELWSTKAAEVKDGYSMTVAPLAVNGVIIVGNSGAEYGTRGFIDGYDAQTGQRLWRRYTVACPGNPAGTHGRPATPASTAAAQPGSLVPMIRSSTPFMGNRQSRLVESDQPRRRQPLHQLGSGARSQDRSDQVALPVFPERRV
jgi:FOG: WD40-like repeat